MSIKSKVVAVAATLTLFGGVGAASALTAGPASAATPPCGAFCLNVFNAQFGPAYLQDVYQQNARVGQPVILFRAANYDPALDWTLTALLSYTPAPVFLTVNDLCAAGLGGLGAGTCARYAGDPIFEAQYSPYGVGSGLCSGVAAGNVAGEGVTLQPCGVSANTWWIVDNAHTFGIGGHIYTAFVNAASGNFTQPLVLTYPANGYPTDKPRPQLYVTNQKTFSNIPVVGEASSNQIFSFFFGQA